MRNTANILSKIVFGLAWLDVVVTLAATRIWYQAIENQDGMAAAFFNAGLVCIGIGSLIFIIIPGFVLYCSNRLRRDVLSVCMAGASVIALMIEHGRLSQVQFRPF